MTDRDWSFLRYKRLSHPVQLLPWFLLSHSTKNNLIRAQIPNIHCSNPAASRASSIASSTCITHGTSGDSRCDSRRCIVLAASPFLAFISSNTQQKEWCDSVVTFFVRDQLSRMKHFADNSVVSSAGATIIYQLGIPFNFILSVTAALWQIVILFGFVLFLAGILLLLSDNFQQAMLDLAHTHKGQKVSWLTIRGL